MTRETAESLAGTAAMLAQRPYTTETGAVLTPCPPHVAAREAIALANLARAMHRMFERECNEDTGCRECQGEGRVLHRESQHRTCRACAGRGSTFGKRYVRLERAADAILRRFGMAAYWQTDPRGWPLYIVPADTLDADDYTRTGHAITPHA